MAIHDYTLQFTAEERGLLLELLQVELRELPVEIHHARSSATRTDLQHRRAIAAALLQRLQAEPAAV